ncbi:MAG: hypothetical protein ACFE96_10410, partial [Candidatus Hermodarchaeota archaeon]
SVISGLCSIIVIALLIFSFYDIFSGKVPEKGVAIPLLLSLMVIMFPGLILFLPLIMGRLGGYLFASVTVLWNLGFFIVIFIIFKLLVNSKKKFLFDLETAELEFNKKILLDDSVLKIFAVSNNVLAQIAFILNVLGLTWTSLIESSLMVLNGIVTFIILIGGIYCLFINKYSTFGSIICIIGSVSIILFPFFYRLIWGIEFVFLYTFDLICIILGILSFIGVIIHYTRTELGSIFCCAMGAISLFSNIFIYHQGAGGFLTIGPYMQFEPILMIIGGYFMYKKHVYRYDSP